MVKNTHKFCKALKQGEDEGGIIALNDQEPRITNAVPLHSKQFIVTSLFLADAITSIKIIISSVLTN